MRILCLLIFLVPVSGADHFDAQLQKCLDETGKKILVIGEGHAKKTPGGTISISPLGHISFTTPEEEDHSNNDAITVGSEGDADIHAYFGERTKLPTNTFEEIHDTSALFQKGIKANSRKILEHIFKGLKPGGLFQFAYDGDSFACRDPKISDVLKSHTRLKYNTNFLNSPSGKWYFMQSTDLWKTWLGWLTEDGKLAEIKRNEAWKELGLGYKILSNALIYSAHALNKLIGAARYGLSFFQTPKNPILRKKMLNGILYSGKEKHRLIQG